MTVTSQAKVVKALMLSDVDLGTVPAVLDVCVEAR